MEKPGSPNLTEENSISHHSYKKMPPNTHSKVIFEQELCGGLKQRIIKHFLPAGRDDNLVGKMQHVYKLQQIQEKCAK